MHSMDETPNLVLNSMSCELDKKSLVSIIHFTSCVVIEWYSDFHVRFSAMKRKTLVCSGAYCKVSGHNVRCSVTENDNTTSGFMLDRNFFLTNSATISFS
jgi:hypothetical protein